MFGWSGGIGRTGFAGVEPVKFARVDPSTEYRCRGVPAEGVSNDAGRPDVLGLLEMVDHNGEVAGPLPPERESLGQQVVRVGVAVMVDGRDHEPRTG